jgi:hypothetical protein
MHRELANKSELFPLSPSQFSGISICSVQLKGAESGAGVSAGDDSAGTGDDTDEINGLVLFVPGLPSRPGLKS